jgi:hypothetical protein
LGKDKLRVPDSSGQYMSADDFRKLRAGLLGGDKQ